MKSYHWEKALNLIYDYMQKKNRAGRKAEALFSDYL